ncbi:Acetyltransferase (GNAT) domain-containing protein [Streptoalloteichus tenebrarius]|uniref:Acetyltransferase (GNAT) domain-containing protein n=1 Tax=Streptoalloteichus tenebrarius (strain ATCC 17920 / DSM 40477 / JCM 4838 / CBS 697.72 / NBRC 16177 / NCIMB 11028 / NRRL B-12390 / A12253. 1 / ISP 5477) TaxID=1933 RepID=A0ABT1HUY1_STRSD|nr:GNAT family N-acetyltransferase [Streptoalloteichus tenebrarius]MCP2259330.1 Acetyltransferase (GNAT) domain-containing protein [Streptoalloteichus tenebrarius]BFE99095.1 GNAT family N-acetyltransferase [Streptoalloteichus tenebrarius]
MTDTAALLAAYDTQLRAAETSHLPPGARAEVDGPVVRVVGQRPRGFVTGPPDLGVDGPALDALIARQRDFFAARGEAVEWKTRGHDRPADLPRRLVAAGFVAEQRETVLVGEAERLAEAPLSPPEGVTVREAVSASDMERIAETVSEVWAEDRSWLAAELTDRVVRNGDGRTVVVVAEAAGRVVSSARLEFEPGTDFAGLWGGSTLAAWRGRGIYRALVTYRARLAVARKTRYLQVDATEDSRPILERMGFVAVTTTTPYVWTPPR